MDADTPIIVAAWPLKVMATFCDVLDEPNCKLKFSGFGLAARPVVLPVPTLKLTGTVIEVPRDVITVTDPDKFPD